MGTTSSGISTLYHWNHGRYHKLWNINPLSLKSWWVPQALEYQPSITEIMMGTTSSGISTLYHWNHDGYHKLWNINPLSLKSWWVPQALEYQTSITEIMMGTTSSGISTLYYWNHDGYHKLWNINSLSLKSWWVPQALEYRINWEIYITYAVSVYILLECSQMGKLKASLLSISFVFKRPYVFALETENLSGFIRNSCVSIDMSEIQTLFLHWLCKSRFH